MQMHWFSECAFANVPTENYINLHKVVFRDTGHYSL
jgi:hypothetical protein